MKRSVLSEVLMHRRHFFRATSETLALARAGVLAIASDVIHSVSAASAKVST